MSQPLRFGGIDC